MGPGRVGIWALIVVGIVYLTVGGGGGFFGLYVAEFRIASVVVAVLAIGAWLAWSVRHPSWRPRTALWPAILACLLALAVSAATAPAPRIAFDFLAYSMLLAALYLLMQRLFAHPFFGPRLGVLAAMLGFGLSGLYIGAVVLHWIRFWEELGRFSTPPLRPGFEGLAYGNPSTVATVVILLWLASAAHFGLVTRRTQVAHLLLGVLTAIVVFLSGSRGAWAGLAIAGLILVPVWLAGSENRSHARRLLADRRTRLVAGAGAISLLLVSVAFLPALVSRLTEPASDTRTAFYQASIRMFLDRSLTGQGPGTWTVERINFTSAPELDYYIPHAHNIWLQTLAELGLVGGLAGVVMVLSVAQLLRRGHRSGDQVQRRLSWAAFAGIAYLGAHQLFDFYPNMPAIGFCLALTVARLDAIASEADRRSVSDRRFGFTAAVLVVGIGISSQWLWRSEQAAALQGRATGAADSGDWASARELADAARAIDPEQPPYLFTAGLAAAHMGDATEARDLLLESARIDGFPTAWLNVARLSADLGDHQAARDAMNNAMRLGYQNPQVSLGVATIMEELGDHEGSVRALAAALTAAPGLASDPYWSDPSRASLFQEGLAAALAEASPVIGYQMALEAGLNAEASAFVERLSEGERDAARLEVAAWNGDEAAFEALRAIARSDPLRDEVVARCRRVAARSHDEDWAGPGPWECGGAGTPGALMIVRVSPPPTTRVVLPGPNAPWHFQYTFRRNTPVDELVPGLPHLAVKFV